MTLSLRGVESASGVSGAEADVAGLVVVSDGLGVGDLEASVVDIQAGTILDREVLDNDGSSIGRHVDGDAVRRGRNLAGGGVDRSGVDDDGTAVGDLGSGSEGSLDGEGDIGSDRDLSGISLLEGGVLGHGHVVVDGELGSVGSLSDLDGSIHGGLSVDGDLSGGDDEAGSLLDGEAVGDVGFSVSSVAGQGARGHAGVGTDDKGGILLEDEVSEDVQHVGDDDGSVGDDGPGLALGNGDDLLVGVPEGPVAVSVDEDLLGVAVLVAGCLDGDIDVGPVLADDGSGSSDGLGSLDASGVGQFSVDGDRGISLEGSLVPQVVGDGESLSCGCEDDTLFVGVGAGQGDAVEVVGGLKGADIGSGGPDSLEVSGDISSGDGDLLGSCGGGNGRGVCGPLHSVSEAVGLDGRRVVSHLDSGSIGSGSEALVAPDGELDSGIGAVVASGTGGLDGGGGHGDLSLHEDAGLSGSVDADLGVVEGASGLQDDTGGVGVLDVDVGVVGIEDESLDGPGAVEVDDRPLGGGSGDDEVGLVRIAAVGIEPGGSGIVLLQGDVGTTGDVHGTGDAGIHVAYECVDSVVQNGSDAIELDDGVVGLELDREIAGADACGGSVQGRGGDVDLVVVLGGEFQVSVENDVEI